jgi:protein arginine kinase
VKGKSDTSPIYQLKSPWKEEHHGVWLASNLQLMRNFAKFPFPQKLDKGRELQVGTLVFDALKQCPELKNPQHLRADELAPLEKEYLLEHFLLGDKFHRAHHGGESFIIDDSGAFLAVTNIENHLHIELMDTEQEIEKSWNRLNKIEECVGKAIDFAYNPKFGFLTANPRECGTGLVITLFLHIPAIIHTGELSELLEKEREDEVEAMGLQGSSTEMIGDILVARNSCTLGLTEEYIVTSLRMWATRAVVAEVSLRKKLHDNEALKNKVARALGLLTHSYQLETVEALNSFSLVKLGLELGWIKSDIPLNLNQIFFDCRRAHLSHIIEKKVEIPQLPRKRAEYLHEIAKHLTLLI